MDLNQLTEDCMAARAPAISACGQSDDGGSANLDATFLPLPKGARAQLVIEAIQRAGLSASASKWLGRGVMIQPPGDGQGAKRYASNQALKSSLSEAGWDCFVYYQMD